MENKTCCKCNSPLDEGFLYVTNSDNPSLFNFVAWVKGEKEKLTTFMGPNANAPQYPVRVFRCEACGHLDFYTDEPQKWKH